MRVLKFCAFVFSLAALLCLSVAAQADCVAKGPQGQKEIVTYDAGVDLVSATNYVPAGTTSEFGLNTPYDAKIPYSGRIESDFDKSGVGRSFLTIERRSLSISRGLRRCCSGDGQGIDRCEPIPRDRTGETEGCGLGGLLSRQCDRH